jgi:hypothetical protein
VKEERKPMRALGSTFKAELSIVMLSDVPFHHQYSKGLRASTRRQNLAGVLFLVPLRFAFTLD